MKINQRKELQILFIGKENDPFSVQAAEFVQLHYPTAKIIYSIREKPFPKELYNWKGDLIISYLSQWIIPKQLLDSANFAAINFHPGPPEYPGIGCTNFAIYDEAEEFGITCHHMNAKVDTGMLIAMKRFPVFSEDTVYSITQQCYSAILDMFYNIFDIIMSGKNLPAANENWKRKPYLRKELNDLCKLTPDMGVDEIERRIKATNYLQPWAFMQADGTNIKLTEADVKNKTYLQYLQKQNA